MEDIRAFIEQHNLAAVPHHVRVQHALENPMILRHLIGCGVFDINAQGRRLMWHFTRHGLVQCIAVLVENGVRITPGDVVGAVAGNQVDVVRQCIGYGINVLTDNTFYLACSRGYLEMVQVLVESGGATPDTENNRAFLLAIASSHHNVVEYLLTKFRKMLINNCSALIWAIDTMNPRMVKILLDAGVDPREGLEYFLSTYNHNSMQAENILMMLRAAVGEEERNVLIFKARSMMDLAANIAKIESEDLSIGQRKRKISQVTPRVLRNRRSLPKVDINDHEVLKCVVGGELVKDVFDELVDFMSHEWHFVAQDQ